MRYTFISIISALALASSSGNAQQVHDVQGPEQMPLTVRPRDVATGTQNPKAGEYPLDSIKGLTDYVVYVPAQCVGAHRCPLVVFLHPAAEISRYVVTRWSPVSDKYGMILLAPTVAAGNWDRVDQIHIDVAMTHVLRNFAIDPNRIAMIGYSASGPAVVALAGHRLDMFSRIILGSTGFLGAESNVISRDSATYFFDPKNQTSEFLLTHAIKESRYHFASARVLRESGHPVTQILGLRGHGSRAEDWDAMGQWLQESWEKPNRATRSAPVVLTDSVPLLTSEILTKMTTFWTKFQQEPDSIRVTAREAHLRRVAVFVADDRPSMLMTDVPALAAKYPSVAADLQAAGLTAQQHEAYRVALVSARIATFVIQGPVAAWANVDLSKVEVKQEGGGVLQGFGGLAQALKSIDLRASSGKSPVSIGAASVQGKNLAFLDAQQAEVSALFATGILGAP